MKAVFSILIAPLVWLASFSAVYAVHGVICGTEFSGTIFGQPFARVLLVSAYGFAVTLQAALLTVLYKGPFSNGLPLVRFVSRASGWVGLVATIWSLFPVVLTTYCVA